MVGGAAALRKSGRLHSAGALLLFPGGAEVLHCAQPGSAGGAGGLWGCLYLHRRGARHAGACRQVASSHRVADGGFQSGCGFADCRAAGGGAVGPGLHAMGGRGAQTAGVAGGAGGCVGGAGICLCLLRFFPAGLQ